MITVYVVKENSDMTEGRGPMRTIGAFTKEEDAWRYADTKSGVMGRRPHSGSWATERYPDVQVLSLHVAETFDELKSLRIAEIRDSALKKLTVEERTVLGLK